MSLRLARLLRSSNTSTSLSTRVKDYSRTSGIRLLNTDAEQSRLQDIDPSKVEVTVTNDKKSLPPFAGLKFGHHFSDHMLTIPWTDGSGWGTPQIRPYAPLQLDPSSTVLHYAQTVFEGMKAYRNDAGRVTMFRPDMNMRRMNTSAARIALPTFNGEGLLELIKRLIRLDKEWIPTLPGYSMYIRPTLIATQRAIGVSPPNEALLFVILSPVGPYYASGFKPVSLYGTTDYVRAAPGGTGAFKLGVNYAPGILPQRIVAEKGYAQNLWLHGPEHYLTEVGTMNLFVVFEKDSGEWELVTPHLDGMILPGVTRDSVLTLVREHAENKRNLDGIEKGRKIVISERSVTMNEVKEAAQKGKLVELFGSGTAAIISPVDRIGYLGDDIHIPTGPDGMGPISGPILKELFGRQTGAIDSEWSVVVEDV